MELICITGIDGGGKSTLAKGVVDVLKKDGINAQYMYGRIIPISSRLLMVLGRLAYLRKKDPWKEFADYSRSKKGIMRNPILRVIYGAAVFLDFYIQIWL